MRLSTDEIRFFKDNGYLIKRNVLDPDLCARARDRLWEGAPPTRKRDDPDTWIGPFTPEEENEDGSNHRKGFRWNFREPGSEDWMIQLLATDPKMWGMAEQFLGKGQVQEPTGIRGIYCTLPYGDAPLKTKECHTDGHAFHVGAVGLIDTVPLNGGAFTVWPGSHRRFYFGADKCYNRSYTPQYDLDRKFFNTQPSVEGYGQAGDVIFWHHRMGHMAASNGSRQIRQAVLYDFRKLDLEQTQDEKPCADMWCDWSDEVKDA
jgi:hypothetical protein